MGKETSIVNECLMALSAAGCLAFRNNTGVLLDRNGRPVQFGLCVGSSDIIAGKPVTITADMVGQTLLAWVAVEVKTASGKTTEAQDRFLAAVRSRGGRAGIARTGAEAVAIARGPAGLPTSENR